jgi:hypothetical protein
VLKRPVAVRLKQCRKAIPVGSKRYSGAKRRRIQEIGCQCNRLFLHSKP